MNRLKLQWAACVLLLLTLLLTAGCWDRQEVDTLGFVTAAAIDPSDEAQDEGGRKQIEMSVQIASIAPPGGPGISAADGEASATSATVMIGRGFSPFDAIINIQSMLARQIYVAHNRVVVVSEELARTDMRALLDYFDRSRQTRRTAALTIAHDMRAGDAITATFPLAGRSGEGLYEMIRLSSRQSGTAITTFHDFFVTVSMDGIDPFLGVLRPARPTTSLVSAQGSQRVTYSGAALFQGDRLAGFMDEAESRGLLWALGRVSTAYLRFSCPDSPDDVIIIEIVRSRGSVRTEIEPEIHGVVEVIAEGRVFDVGCRGGFERTADSVKEMHTLARRQLEREITSAIARAQDLLSDPFGFGAALMRRSPRVWRDVENTWYTAIWPNMRVETKVKFDIRRPGLVAGPYAVDRS